MENLPGFNAKAGLTWVYPTNVEIRDYQYNIAQKALFNNVLVSLPTGRGKTFIAAVVMFNIYRWYPDGKILFLVPTRSLVNQQDEACYKLMGVPQDEMIDLTGTQLFCCFAALNCEKKFQKILAENNLRSCCRCQFGEHSRSDLALKTHFFLNTTSGCERSGERFLRCNCYPDGGF